jgi:hypothetical protein
MKQVASWRSFALRVYLGGIGMAACTFAAAQPPAPDCHWQPGTAQATTVDFEDYEGVDHEVTYYVRNKVCYGDGAVWLDPSAPHGPAYLTERASLWTNADPALDTPNTARAVIIWSHPGGLSEQFQFNPCPPQCLGADNPYSQTVQFQSVLVPAMQAGYALVSIEFRHPISSYPDGGPPPGNTDVRDAVQYVRANAALLHIDPNNMFLVGQSRGSLNMLWGIRADARDLNDPRAWRHVSSKVNAIWDYQAQTCYDETAVETTFLLGNWYQAFHDDPAFQYVPDQLRNLAGCAFQDAANVPAESIPPMRIMYDEMPADTSTVTLQPWCLSTLNQRTDCWINNRWHDQHNIWNTWFDEHDANYGVAINNAYLARGAGTLLTVCYGVTVAYCDPSGPFNGYLGYTDFLGMHQVPPLQTQAPACPVVHHKSPPPNCP